MGACVSHGSSIASGDDSASSSCRLREQRQGSTGDSGPNSTSPSCRLHCQVQGTTALSPQKRNSNTSGNKQRQLQQHHGLPRSRRDNFCLWWCCCCKCSCVNVIYFFSWCLVFSLKKKKNYPKTSKFKKKSPWCKTVFFSLKRALNETLCQRAHFTPMGPKWKQSQKSNF